MSTTPAWLGAQAKKTTYEQMSTSVQNTQARVVQHHYVRAQLRTLSAQAQAMRNETIAQLKRNYPAAKSWDQAKLEAAFDKMTEKLQKRDLTINFGAKGWFSEPNNSEDYAQMYERGQVMNGTRLISGDGNNPADTRISADNKATFGARKPGDAVWGLDRTMNPLHAGYTKTADPSGGLNHTFVQKEGDISTMRTQIDAEKHVVHLENPFFNPKTKQVFAALNYGKQPHGPANRYGMSYFVLNDRFKDNAIFFIGDTFHNQAQGIDMRNSAKDQVPYQLLGALYGKSGMYQKLQRALTSCTLDGQKLADQVKADCEFYIVEAHLFGPLKFSGGIQEIYLSRRANADDKSEFDSKTWEKIQKNAKAFAKRTGAKLVVESKSRFGF